MWRLFRHLPLDVVVVFDATASMGPHIKNVEKNIDALIESLLRHHYLDLRMGGVAYRDHMYPNNRVANVIP